MRKASKRPFTDRAASMVLKELAKLQAAGYDPNACLDQSTLHGWLDVWPTKDKVIEDKPGAQADQTREMLQKWDKEREASRGSKVPENLLKMVRK